MELPGDEPMVFTNATVVTAERAFAGHVVVEDGLIAEVGEGPGPRGGFDCQGDYLLPGLIELHTDHLEAHYMPRPRVSWHAGSAVLAYDAQIAAAGITTVFDSFRCGTEPADEERGDLGQRTLLLAEAVESARAAGLLRVDHLTHLRCEIPTPNVVAGLEAFLDAHPVNLISLMDHTPGQRQFRDLDKYFIYYGGKTGRTMDQLVEVAEHRKRVGRELGEANRPRIVEIARGARAQDGEPRRYDRRRSRPVASRGRIHRRIPDDGGRRRGVSRMGHVDGDGRAERGARRLAFGQRLGARIGGKWTARHPLLGLRAGRAADGRLPPRGCAERRRPARRHPPRDEEPG